MAIFRLSATVISRSAGRSATAAAAYRAGERIEDQRSGEVFDFSRKGSIEHTEIMAPDRTPDWMRHRSTLWNAVEAAERRKDAQLAREIQLALPRELSPEQRQTLVRDFVQSAFVARGMIADVAIHNPPAKDGGEQPHAHVMLTMRVLTGDGFGAKERSWNSDELLSTWRAEWAERANQHLEQAGSGERIDHRSLAEQRADHARRAEAMPPGLERAALEIKTAELTRDPTPTLRASYYMEDRARREAANDNRVYQPVTDRGAWLEAFRAQAAERLAVLHELTQAIKERATQMWSRVNEQFFGKEPPAAPVNGGMPAGQTPPPSSAADRLRQAEEIARAAHEGARSGQQLSAAERLRQAEEIARRPAEQRQDGARPSRQDNDSQSRRRAEGQE